MEQKSTTSFGHRNYLTKHLNTVAVLSFWPLEKMLTYRANETDCDICFVFGPPRSGTTLLYEMITAEFECAYFPNIAQRLYRAPVAATWIYRNAIKRRKGSFDSTFGELPGNAAPSEDGRIWRYWMPYFAPHTHAGKGISRPEIQTKLSAMCNILGRPMVIKYLHFHSELPRLIEFFPNAVFINIERNWKDNVRSILKWRKIRKGPDSKEWFSAQPEGWEKYMDCDPVTQACAQVALSHKAILKYLGDSDRLLSLSYDAVCRNPMRAMEQVEELFNKGGLRCNRKFQISKSFQVHGQKELEPEIEAQIQNALMRFQP
ncbi:MAG: sulfotransferase [Roseovarius sp.]|jgi:hypothetical protein|uniref:sulfotransferase n=1 Tax=Roseovarius sp. TaxID=1486281 RepID=UPI0032EC397E